MRDHVQPRRRHRAPFHRHHEPGTDQAFGEQLLQQGRLVDRHPVGRRQRLDHGHGIHHFPGAVFRAVPHPGRHRREHPGFAVHPELRVRPDEPDHSCADQGRELFGTQGRRPAREAFHKRFEPAAEPGNPRFIGDAAVRDGGLQDRPAVVQGADGHLHRVVLPQRGTPGVVEQIVDDGAVEFRAGVERPPGQRRRESQQVQPVGRTDVDVQDGVHRVFPFRGGVRVRAQGLLQRLQELLRFRQDGARLRARQRRVVGPERVAVQERPEVMVEGGPDSRFRELRQGVLGAVFQRHGVGVVAGEGGLGPVRGAAPRGRDDERFAAGGKVAEPAVRAGQEPAAAALGQLAHGIKEVQAHAAHQHRFNGGHQRPVDVGRGRRRQVQQPELRRRRLEFALLGAEPRFEVAEGQHHGIDGEDRAVGQFDVEPHRAAVAAAGGGGSVADGRRRRAVELHRGAGGEAGQQLLQGGAEVAAVQSPAGEVRRGQPGQFGALLGCEGGVGLLLLQFTPAVEGVPGQRRARGPGPRG